VAAGGRLEAGPGQPSGGADRALTPAVASDGSFVGSIGLTLKPGPQTVSVAVVAPDGRGSVTTLPLEVPDFGRSELTLGRLLLFPEATEALSTDPGDPYAAFVVGSLRLRPRLGNLFAESESVELISTIYNAAVDPGTGKASVKARFSFLQGGKLVARGGDQTFETPVAVASVGPVPLSGFTPGQYLARVEVTDAVANKTQSQEVVFQVR